MPNRRAADVWPADLRTEDQVDPIGIGIREPRLSWRLIPRRGRRNVGQAACQVEMVVVEGAAMWDSGRVATGVPWLDYAGPALESRSQIHWRVRTWDGGGRVSGWSVWAGFEMGLLDDADRQAPWIGAPRPAPDPRHHLRDAFRIWAPPGSGDESRVIFRHTIAVGGGEIAWARLQATGGVTMAWLNGGPIDPTTVRDERIDAVVTGLLHAGRNTIAIEARGRPDSPSGMLAELALGHIDGTEERIVSDGRWSVAVDPARMWQDDDATAAGWSLAVPIARWGDPPWGRDPAVVRPAVVLRRRFSVSGPVRRARLYASALGVYELWIDGAPVSDERLAPGWTDYRRRVEYQTYDVPSSLLTPGDHVLGAVVADGWYAGHVGLWGPGRYGRDPRFWCRLELESPDGQRRVIASDESWQAAEGSIRYADLQMGQTIDHRHAEPVWTEPDEGGAWTAVRVGPGAANLVARSGPPTRVMSKVRPVSIATRDDGRVVVDMGQNIVGWVRLTARGPVGERILLRHGEALEPDGRLLANLRSAQALDEFILGGTGEEVFEPRFTVHGFRYVEVTGYPGTLDADAVVGCVVHADMDLTGGFACSQAGLTRLQQNILWSQRGNFLSVPTDCPQRDERLGWTGDAQVFASTAMFNMNVRRFFERWIDEVCEAQQPGGAIPDVVPEVAEIGSGTSGWGDAVVIVPWTLHRCYADERVARRAFPAILRWLEYLADRSNGFVLPATGYGDWLSVDAETPRDLVATAYFAYSARLAAELGRVLRRDEDAATCDRLVASVREAFRARFVRGGGTLLGGTQTAYVAALRAGLFEPGEVLPAVDHLVADIRNRNWHLSTGFLGTPWLLPVLAEHGRLDVAYRLLLRDTYPSWLDQVNRGATTMWERWDAFTEGKGFATSLTTAGIATGVMNSLNHYAYGSVGSFMYEYLGGLRVRRPGYELVRIEPRPAPGVSWADTWIESVRGRIACRWRNRRGELVVDVTVPPGVTAEIVLPARLDAIDEGRAAVTAARWARAVREEGGETLVVVGSGSYRFRVRRPAA